MTTADDLAAAMFPAEWAAASRATGKRAQNRRRSLRRQAEYESAMVPLRAAGRSCGSCDSFEKAPFPTKGMICDAESDFHGYTRAEATGLCPRWRARPGIKTLSPEDEATIRKAAGAEWDATVPRWSMDRETFVQWHVDMATGAVRPTEGAFG